jgi:hypothetical protein
MNDATCVCVNDGRNERAHNQEHPTLEIKNDQKKQVEQIARLI